MMSNPQSYTSVLSFNHDWRQLDPLVARSSFELIFMRNLLRVRTNHKQ
jgi:hypothetical protein